MHPKATNQDGASADATGAWSSTTIRVRVGIPVRNRGGAVGSTPALICGGLRPSRVGSIPTLISNFFVCTIPERMTRRMAATCRKARPVIPFTKMRLPTTGETIAGKKSVVTAGETAPFGQVLASSPLRWNGAQACQWTRANTAARERHPGINFEHVVRGTARDAARRLRKNRPTEPTTGHAAGATPAMLNQFAVVDGFCQRRHHGEHYPENPREIHGRNSFPCLTFTLLTGQAIAFKSV